jgi:hypothetical protein
MDYPELNLFFGWILIFMLVLSVGLRLLLTKVHVSVWLSQLSWAVLILHILSTLYIEFLFLQRMSYSFNWQIIVGWLVIGGIGTFVIASLYRKEISPRMSGFLLGAQIFTSLVGLVIAYGLYRSLVPI